MHDGSFSIKTRTVRRDNNLIVDLQYSTVQYLLECTVPYYRQLLNWIDWSLRVLCVDIANYLAKKDYSTHCLVILSVLMLLLMLLMHVVVFIVRRISLMRMLLLLLLLLMLLLMLLLLSRYCCCHVTVTATVTHSEAYEKMGCCWSGLVLSKLLYEACDRLMIF